MTRFGAIEAGGTKFLCGVGTGPDDLETISVHTTTPDATIGACIEYLAKQNVAAVGISCFGPVDLHPDSSMWGYITSTPKQGWANCNVAGTIGRALGVPVGFDTDVNGAALGEARWGAAKGLSDFLYLTIGTGIGGGAIANGRVIHGLVHPEMGHIRVPHDRARDPFVGSCPFHGDCLEGLAAGPAIEKRWDSPGMTLAPDHPAWELEAHYLALGLANWVCTLSPKRIVMGGGVMQQAHLFPLIRCELQRLLAGYVQTPEVEPPALGTRSGVLGALVLAEQVLR